MPELPEVETIVRDLNKNVLGQKIEGVWSDAKKLVKKPPSFERFKREIKGRKIIKVRRRAKNILFDLSGDKILLVHQKMTGHFLFGKWKKERGKWEALEKGPLSDDPMNRFLHLIFFLKSEKQLALSDLRKFAKVELWDKKDLEKSKEFKGLGPEPLEESFTFERFKSILPKRGKVKQVLMDQKVIAGIGNIYADEILWRARVHPSRDVLTLRSPELKKIYREIKEVLRVAIKLGGTSISDYRRISGKKGYFERERKVYRKTGEKCFRCGTMIKRIKIGGRSSHFCPYCQKP